MSLSPAANSSPPPSSETQALTDALSLSFKILRIVMIALLVLTVLRSALFIVPQQQNAFVLRFGRITGHGDARIRGPGPHLAFPSPIDEIVRLPGDQMLTLHSDSFYHGLDDRTTTPIDRMRRRPYFHATLTADRNLLHSRWTLRYTVTLPDAYVFDFRHIERLILLELDRAVLLAMVHTPVDKALRADREIRETVQRRLTQRVDALGLGIRVHQVEADRITPPPAIAGAFDSVIAAEQESNEIVSQSRIDAARIVGDARATAADRLAAAQAFAVRMSEKTAADAARLQALQAAGLTSTGSVLTEAMRMERVARLLAGDNAPRIIRLRAAPAHRELRLHLSGDPTAAINR